MATDREAHENLDEVLREFVTTPRFTFLKSLQVGPILGEDAGSLGEISKMTFEQLASSLNDHASLVCRLNSAQERLLITLLRALSEGETNASEAEEGEASSKTTFNSVQCEIELRERISSLKSHPNLDTIKDIQVGHYWPEESPRAPFEESFTIKQLLGLDLGVLAKKRSMTSERMNVLALALVNALQELNGAHDEKEVESVPEPVAPTREPLRLTKHRWSGRYDKYAPREMALVESVVRGVQDGTVHSPEILEALNHYCAAFSVEDFLKIMQSQPLTAATQRKLLAWVKSGSLRTYIPVVHLSLQGPGIHISSISQIFRGAAPAQALYGILAMLVVRGLSAQEVVVMEEVCRDVWTTNSNLATLIVEAASAVSKATFPRALSSVCPDMDPILQDWMYRVVPLAKRGKKRRKSA